MEDSKSASGNGGCGLCSIYAAACCLAADQLYIFVFNKVVKGSDGIGAAAYTGKDASGSLPSFSSICSLISLEITA